MDSSALITVKDTTPAEHKPQETVILGNRSFFSENFWISFGRARTLANKRGLHYNMSSVNMFFQRDKQLHLKSIGHGQIALVKFHIYQNLFLGECIMHIKQDYQKSYTFAHLED